MTGVIHVGAKRESPMLTPDALAKAAAGVEGRGPRSHPYGREYARYYGPDGLAKFAVYAFLAAQDREELLQMACNAAWPTAKKLCQDEYTDMCFGDVVAIARAVIAALLDGEVPDA